MNTDLVRLLFIFSFAVVGFSQYLRNSASATVRDLHDRARDYERDILSLGEEMQRTFTENQMYQQATGALSSDDCRVSYGGNIWSYFLFVWLLLYIALGVILQIYLHHYPGEIAKYITLIVWGHGLYILFALFLNCMVFFSAGYSTIKPKSKARKAFDELETTYHTLRSTLNNTARTSHSGRGRPSR